MFRFLIVLCIVINGIAFHNQHVFGHKHLTRSRATSLSDEQPSQPTEDEENRVLSPLGKLLLKRNDVMGYNADTFPPRSKDGQPAKRQMAWPFQVRQQSNLFSCSHPLH